MSQRTYPHLWLECRRRGHGLWKMMKNESVSPCSYQVIDHTRWAPQHQLRRPDTKIRAQGNRRRFSYITRESRHGEDGYGRLTQRGQIEIRMRWGTSVWGSASRDIRRLSATPSGCCISDDLQVHTNGNIPNNIAIPPILIQRGRLTKRRRAAIVWLEPCIHILNEVGWDTGRRRSKRHGWIEEDG